MPAPQIVLGAAETLQILGWNVHAAALEIRRHVADDVRQLQRNAEIDRVIARLQIAIPENLDADQPDRRRHAQAVLPQLLERVVAVALQIHGHAVDQILEGRPRQLEPGDERSQALPCGVAGSRPS